MTAARIPGPIGCETIDLDIEAGTLAKTPPFLPGPTGLHAGPKVPGKSPTAIAAAPQGIRIHDLSKISAQDWVDKIKASKDNVPAFFLKPLQVTGQVISLKGYAVPRDVIHDDWFDDWPAAFKANTWEVTTGGLEISVTVDAQGSHIVGVLNPDLSRGEVIDGLTKFAALTIKGHDTKDFRVEYGSTMPDGVTLNSGRKLIAIANRVTLRLGDKIVKNFSVTDPELLNSWFHEISCHAGRNAGNKPDVHGDKNVEDCAADIDRRIPTSATTSAIAAEIDAFLKPASKPLAGKHS
jgi:hypothetical protein